MKNTIKVALAMIMLASSLPAATGFQVKGPQLLDANGNVFVMRGVNHAHTWYSTGLNTAIPAIAATGANTVRIVLATGDRWTMTSASEVRQIITIVKKYNMIAVLEVHDCTGYKEQAGSVPLSNAVDYWLTPEIKAELVGQEAYVIINIANEPFGNDQTATEYLDANKAAVIQLRTAGLTHTLMIDAANWGQDWKFTTRDNAKEILAADPLSNIIFSVHMYDIFNTEAKVNSYLQAFVTAKLALVVGEFAATHGVGKPVAAEAILRLTTANGQGYLGWSWFGNGAPLQSLDLALTMDGSTLTTWGELLINNANGIKARATPASIFTTGLSSNTILSSSSSTPNISSMQPSSSSKVTSQIVSSENVISSARQDGNVVYFSLSQDELVQWTILNFLGQRIGSVSSNNLGVGAHSIPLNHLCKGTYLVHMRTVHGETTLRVQIQD